MNGIKRSSCGQTCPSPSRFLRLTHSLTPFTIAPLWWIAAIIDINPATYITYSIQSVHSQVSHSLLWSVNRTAKLQRQLILYQYECNLAVGSWDPKFAAVQHEPRTIPAGNQNPRQTKTKNKKVKIKPCWSIGNAIVFFFWNATPLCDNGTCRRPSGITAPLATLATAVPVGNHCTRCNNRSSLEQIASVRQVFATTAINNKIFATAMVMTVLREMCALARLAMAVLLLPHHSIMLASTMST